MEKVHLNPSDLKQKLCFDLHTFLESEPHNFLSLQTFFTSLLSKYFSSNRSNFHEFLLSLSSEDRTLLFIRHGESQYNHWRKKSCCNLPIFYLNKPNNYDPRLTDKGHEQAGKAVDTLISFNNKERINIDTVYVSPLTRALETYMHFDKSLKKANEDLQVLAMDLIRERMDYACDIGSKKEILVEEFGKNVDFKYVSREIWWRSNEMDNYQELSKEKIIDESKNMVYLRVLMFITLVLLEDRGRNVLIVSHQNVHKCLFRNYAVFGTKIRNCEIQKLNKKQLNEFLEQAVNLLN